MNLKLGERLNNPCNLEYNPRIKWEGAADPPFEGPYCSYTTAHYGLRAGARDLHTKWREGLYTVAAIVRKFAPRSENDTAAYIKDVSERIGVDEDEELDLADPGELAALVRAVIIHEQGRCIYSADEIMACVRDALSPG